jgi:D-psicose/D-tagatose/L-ribulose 3-epimerase
MPTFGVHAFTFVGDWNTETGNYAIDQAGRIGFDMIEMPLLRPAEFNAASHRSALKKAKIGATCSLALPKAVHMPHHPEEAHKFMLAAIEQTEAVGSHYLAGCIAYSLGVLTGAPPTTEERQTVVDVLKSLCADAKARGITLALEACNRYETYMYNTLADTRAAIKAVGAPNLKLHADTYHMNIEEENFTQPFVETADVLDYIHMSESHRGMVGTGTVKWKQVFRGLAQINFKGYLVLESFAAINPDLAAATCLWRAPKHDGPTLAKEGLKFLKKGAKRAGLN